jgi:ABC-type nitrate/sulfonate/bicarbonate transport system substrate-binding protein
MKKRMLFSTFLFLLPFLIAALLPHALPAQEKKSLRIVFVSLSWNNQLPFRIAIAKGFFKDQGLTVAPFTAEDTVRLLDKGFPMIVMNEALRIPQSIFVTRGEMLQKNPETTKRFLKAVILGMQFAKQHKKEALQTGFAAGLTGDPDVASRSYDLFSSGYAADLAVAQEGIQIMLDEDIRAELVEKKFTLDHVINDRILKQAQRELRNEGRLKP